jgi:hypothetical protein
MLAEPVDDPKCIPGDHFARSPADHHRPELCLAAPPLTTIEGLAA